MSTRRTAHVWTPEKVAHLKQLRADGMSNKKIARLYKCSSTNIDQVFARDSRVNWPERKELKAKIYRMTEAAFEMAVPPSDITSELGVLLGRFVTHWNGMGSEAELQAVADEAVTALVRYGFTPSVQLKVPQP